MFISVCISICRTCLVLSVVVPVHFICFTVGEWETFFSIPLYVLTCKVIDNKATLTLTLTLTHTYTPQTQTNCPLHFYHFTTYCYTCTANVLHTSHRMSFAAFFCTTCHFKVNLCCCTGICMCITICICISICLVLSVVVHVHFIYFTLGEWETFFRFLCMS